MAAAAVFNALGASAAPAKNAKQQLNEFCQRARLSVEATAEPRADGAPGFVASLTLASLVTGRGAAGAPAPALGADEEAAEAAVGLGADADAGGAGLPPLPATFWGEGRTKKAAAEAAAAAAIAALQATPAWAAQSPEAPFTLWSLVASLLSDQARGGRQQITPASLSSGRELRRRRRRRDIPLPAQQLAHI